MKDTDIDKIIELTPVGGGFLPRNEKGQELADTATGVISLIEVTARDIKFHSAYFSLLSFIYSWLPKTFKEKIPKDKFYLFVKHLKGDYDIVMRFKDGTTLVNYKSISFSRMSQIEFENYVRDQLPFIYTEVIEKLYDEKDSKRIIESIETEYLNFLSKL